MRMNPNNVHNICVEQEGTIPSAMTLGHLFITVYNTTVLIGRTKPYPCSSLKDLDFLLPKSACDENFLPDFIIFTFVAHFLPPHDLSCHPVHIKNELILYDRRAV